MVGLELPVLAMEHMYLLTEPMPEVAAFKPRTGREMVGRARPSRARSTPGRSAAGCCSAPTRRTAGPGRRRRRRGTSATSCCSPTSTASRRRSRSGFRHFPALENAGIKQVINGPFTFAPDGNPLVGPVQGLTNFWVACAVMAGFSQGGGVGLVLANWMTAGDPGPRRLRHGRGALRRVGELALHQRQGARELFAALLDPLPERGAERGAAAADDAALRHHGARAERGDGRDLGARGAALVRARRASRAAGRAVVPPLERFRGGGRGGSRGARGRRRHRDRQLRQVRGDRPGRRGLARPAARQPACRGPGGSRSRRC